MSTFWRQAFGGGAEVYENLCAPALSSVGDSDISWLYCGEMTEMTKLSLQEPHLPPFVEALLPTPVDAITFSVQNTGSVNLSDYRDVNRWAQGVTHCQQDPRLVT
jgi:hypothetical protein